MDSLRGRVYEAEGSEPVLDEDADGTDDRVDNCPGLPNPDQADRGLAVAVCRRAPIPTGRDTRRQQRQILKLTSIEREFLHVPRVNDGR